MLNSISGMSVYQRYAIYENSREWLLPCRYANCSHSTNAFMQARVIYWRLNSRGASNLKFWLKCSVGGAYLVKWLLHVTPAVEKSECYSCIGSVLALRPRLHERVPLGRLQCVWIESLYSWRYSDVHVLARILVLQPEAATKFMTEVFPAEQSTENP